MQPTEENKDLDELAAWEWQKDKDIIEALRAQVQKLTDELTEVRNENIDLWRKLEHARRK